MKKRKIVALVCVAAVLLLAVSAFGYVQSKLDKINKVPDTVDVIPPDQEDFETDASNEPKDIIELKPEEVDWSERTISGRRPAQYPFGRSGSTRGRRAATL